jgi:allophanate hydrolase
MTTTRHPPVSRLALGRLQHDYLSGALTPSLCIEDVLARIANAGRPEIWIARVEADSLRAQARALDAVLAAEGAAALARLPLLGVPFAVKDNIDVAGMPTTAACPAFAYVPGRSATVVEKLLAAGALLVGKTNLDQFATGLVGTRSPYGAVRNAVDPAYVSGGSSSGSAVAVALGMAGFALGTDTAGSGRVPAGLNGIVGLKPTRGLLSTRGVVPACRTLDCVSVFATSVADAWKVTQVAAGYDPEDAYSRRVPAQGVRRRGYRIALPAAPEFFGDSAAQAAFEATLARLRALPGCTFGTVDFAPFRDAAALLYQGPWVAERHAAVGAFIDAQPDAAHPVVAAIIGQGKAYSATDAFAGQYRLAELRRAAEASLAGYDFLLVPTTPTMPRIADVLAQPVALNSQLGYYTNFVNFFDMAALAVPGETRRDGLPAGVTLVGSAGSDHLLAVAAAALLGDAQEAAALAADPLPRKDPLGDPFSEPVVQLAVVGAHLDGQPLNWQLLERGARKIAATHTAPCYRLYALRNTAPPKPGLARVDMDGTAIEVEVWELPVRRFGEFVAEVAQPLGIGSLELADGRWVKGFICEPAAIAGAEDITAFGGWRAYLGRPANAA